MTTTKTYDDEWFTVSISWNNKTKLLVVTAVPEDVDSTRDEMDAIFVSMQALRQRSQELEKEHT